MTAETTFQQNYEKHLQHLKLKGLQPKAIDASARSVRYIGTYFDDNIRNLSKQQLTDYFVHTLHTLHGVPLSWIDTASSLLSPCIEARLAAY